MEIMNTNQDVINHINLCCTDILLCIYVCSWIFIHWTPYL